MAGSRLPAVNDPLCENTAIQKVNPHILCSPLFGAFGSPSTSNKFTPAVAHVRAFEFLGGCSELVIPDNLGSAVSRAHRYEPDTNPTYHDLARHYPDFANSA